MEAVAGLWCKTISEFAFMWEASHFFTSIESLKAISVLLGWKHCKILFLEHPVKLIPSQLRKIRSRDTKGAKECIQPTVKNLEMALAATRFYQVRPIPRFLEHFSRSKTQKNPVVSFSFRVSSFPSIASSFNLSFTIHTHFTRSKPFDLPASKV